MLRRLKSDCINARGRFVSQIICISQMSYRSEQSSNDRKIARIAPIPTIFGPIESQRHDLFLENFSNKRNEQKFFKNIVAMVAAIVVVGRFRRDTNRMPLLGAPPKLMQKLILTSKNPELLQNWPRNTKNRKTNCNKFSKKNGHRKIESCKSSETRFPEVSWRSERSSRGERTFEVRRANRKLSFVGSCMHGSRRPQRQRRRR